MPPTRLRSRRTVRTLAALLLTGVLSACATTPPVSPSPRVILPTAERNQVVASLKQWQASGQAALSTPKSSENFGFDWKQAPRHQEFSVYDPLGRTVARITVDPRGAHLQLANGDIRQADTLEALLALVLHVDLPANELPDWMLGLRRGAATEQQNAAGLPEVLRSGPWRIQYLQYAPVGGLTMPKLLQATGPEGITLRLAITQWRMGKPGTP
ncbi:lipoprotein insertase outer membrane protein LolB [Acidithiobacillus sp.]|uniref:lipoprotein insertase outer membrane protein LolB n=1 Tax=Acidithiobacillus sp. TaxID=1872118 RepID=UPI002589C231|nr:lipoprotein insertase outer membrane protein LolB [Acidithiobacillus sp.]MDD5376118.1 lipoprotein insertase outer membrane protein LolB [Acidithiobacillus sp.]